MRKSYRKHLGLCAAAILAWLSATAGAAPISSLVDDFDINVNSTSSTWSYGTVVPASNPFVMKLLDTKAKTMAGIFSSDTALPVWASTDFSWAYWMLGKNTGASAIHSLWGDTLDFQPGTIMLYPGQDGRNLLVSWLAPSDMVINANWTFTRISARKSGSPWPAGQGTDYRVTHRSGAGDTTLVGFAGVARPGGTLYDSHSSSFAGLSVKAGDRVFWEIAGFNNTVDVDATGAAITVDGGPSLASSAIVDDQSGASVTTGTVVTYTVTFSEDMDDTTVSDSDFGNAGTAGFSIGTVTETAPTSGVFTVPVTTTSTGTLQLKVNQNAVLNSAGGIPLNTISAILDDTTLNVADPGDTTPPTLTSIADDKGGGPAERNALVTYTVTFDEAMDPSTISADDFGNAGTAAVTIGTVTQTAPAVFSVPVTPTTTGTLQLRVIAGADLKDLAGNALVVPDPAGLPDDNTLTVADTIPPTLTSIVDDKSPATIAPNTLVTYTVTFSEGMDAGTVSDADFGNAGSAAVTIGTVTETTPGVFTVQATPTSGGTLQLQVNAGVELKDVAGNALVTTSAIPDDTTITVDGTPPDIASLSPVDDATGAVANANLVVTFNEAIAIGTTGDITIKNLTDATESTIAITSGSPQVTVAGSVLAINPTEDLLAGKDYAIQIAATAIKDLYGNFFAGIGDDTTWNFSTDGTPPTIATLSPADDATGAVVNANLVVTFNEAIAIGTTGNITIKNLTDGPSYDVTIAITSGSPQVTVAGSVLTINPTADLAMLKSYAIQIDATAIKDLSGNVFAGIADDTTWNFTTATSLVANWRLDESSGNAISDANATYNGTLNGSPSPTQNAPGKIGTAYTLNGTNYVAPGGPPSPVSSTLTISAWVYPTATNYGNIVHWNVGGRDIQFGMNNGVGMRYRQDTAPLAGGDDGNFASSSGNTVPLNTWTHVVFVRNGTACTIYANGISIASGTVPVPTVNPTLMEIGFGAANNLIGSIDDVAIWTTALSGAQVQTLSNVLAVNSGALNDYSVRYMDKLFTAYDTNTSQSVTTPNGTLIWEKFSGSSGTAGQVTYTDGVYKAWFTDTEGVATIASANPYTTWASANAGGQTAGEDYDNDGVENGIEYFMGETGSSFTAMPGLDETNTITWPMDLNFEGTYEVQTSPDLGTWTNVDPRPLPSGGALSYLLPTGLGKQFVRLLVTPTP